MSSISGHEVKKESAAPLAEQTDSSNENRSVFVRGANRSIRFYQRRISPLFGRCCIYTPSCSEYTRQAIVKYGIIKGSYLGCKRILRCHPFHTGGYDPVP